MTSNVTTTTYKAIRCTQLSKSIDQGIENLQLQDVERVKTLKPYEIRLEVYASCVNFFDLLITIGTYQHKPEMPYTMGSECSGKIIEVGSKVDMYKIGDNVIVPMGGGGCMASEMIVRQDKVIPMPNTLSYTQAAGVGVGFMTGYHALVHRGHIKKGDWLLVTGAGGGMGLSAVQIGRALGAKVIAAASTDEKCELAKKYGAHYAINYSKQKIKDEVERITNKELIDVCYDPVGGNIFNECLRAMRPNSRLLIIGFASGQIPKIPANIVLVKGIDVVGVRSGAEMIRDPMIGM